MLCEALFPKWLTGAWCLHLECLPPAASQDAVGTCPGPSECGRQRELSAYRET